MHYFSPNREFSPSGLPRYTDCEYSLPKFSIVPHLPTAILIKFYMMGENGRFTEESIIVQHNEVVDFINEYTSDPEFFLETKFGRKAPVARPKAEQDFQPVAASHHALAEVLDLI